MVDAREATKEELEAIARIWRGHWLTPVATNAQRDIDTLLGHIAFQAERIGELEAERERLRGFACRVDKEFGSSSADSHYYLGECARTVLADHGGKPPSVKQFLAMVYGEEKADG